MIAKSLFTERVYDEAMMDSCRKDAEACEIYARETSVNKK